MATNTTALPVSFATLSEREQRFAEHMAVFDSPVDAWKASGEVKPSTKRISMQRAAYRMLALPHVRQRITELRNRIAADGPQAHRAALVQDLQAMADQDIEEIATLHIRHCDACYSAPSYVASWPRNPEAVHDESQWPMKPGEFDPDREPCRTCASCRGAGVPVVHYTPFDQLSAPAKRLVRGIECNADGSIKKLLIADQAQLRMELHRATPGFHVPTTSVNLNINTAKPLKAGMSVDEALAILATIAPTESTEQSVVSDQ